MSLSNPVIIALLLLPSMLGSIVLVRMLVTAARVARASFQKVPRKNPAGTVIPLLDEPFACPTCERLETVSVRRADFREMPYVEHFLCHGCGTEFLGPNQEKMVAKRLEARRKVADVLAGRSPIKVSFKKK